MNPKLSIIIAHINEGYMLNMTLDSIYNCVKYDNYEIIVVDDGSLNLTDLDFIKNHFLSNKIRVYFQNGLGVANARNYGAKKSCGDYLFFLDSHMYFYEDSISILMRDIQSSGYDIMQPTITSLTQKDLNGNHYYISSYELNSNWECLKFKSESGLYDTPNIAGGATLISRKVYDSLDGFCKYFIKWGVEDLDLSTRAWLNGYQCGLNTNTRIAHYFKESFQNTIVSTENVLNNKIMFMYNCFDDKYIPKIENALFEYAPTVFEGALDIVNQNDQYLDWNERMRSDKKYDIQRYFDKFKIFYSFID